MIQHEKNVSVFYFLSVPFVIGGFGDLQSAYFSKLLDKTEAVAG